MSSVSNARVQAHVERITATLRGVQEAEGLETAIACAIGNAIGGVDWTVRNGGFGAGAQLLLWVAERAFPTLTKSEAETLTAAVIGHLSRRAEMHGGEVAETAAEALLRGAEAFLVERGKRDVMEGNL